MNPEYQTIAEGFVQYYYQHCGTNELKPNLTNLYHESALCTYETEQKQGRAGIMEKIMRLPSPAAHVISKTDSQPLEDGSILILVLGQVKTEGETNPLGFSHTFLIKPEGGNWFIHREIFQLTLHNF